MTLLSKQNTKSEGRKVDLTRHSDDELHNLMDSVTREMARRASVNAKRRALVRRLESLAESEGVTLDEVRQYLRGDERLPEQVDELPEEELELEVESEEEAFPGLSLKKLESSMPKPSLPKSPLAREESLDRQLESMFQKELAELT